MIKTQLQQSTRSDGALAVSAERRSVLACDFCHADMTVEPRVEVTTLGYLWALVAFLNVLLSPDGRVPGLFALLVSLLAVSRHKRQAMQQQAYEGLASILSNLPIIVRNLSAAAWGLVGVVWGLIDLCYMNGMTPYSASLGAMAIVFTFRSHRWETSYQTACLDRLIAQSSAAKADSGDDVILSVNDLAVQFKVEGNYVTAVDGLTYQLRRGETLGIVGESGSGKSVTNLAVMGLLPVPPGRVARGQIIFESKDLLKQQSKVMQRIRGNKIAMIFQDPMSSLNPFLKISAQLNEVTRRHKNVCWRCLNTDRTSKESIAMLERVGIPDPETRFHQYPHQFSGGMRQRVMIAMMLLNEPEILIADEPTTALDVTVQAQILDLLRKMQDDLNTAITLITHDLGVVAEMADHVLVMYSGRTMESAPTKALFANPSHPYTLGLLRSLPNVARDSGERLYSIPGLPPDLDKRPKGCPFAPRCTFAKSECGDSFPPATQISDDHVVYCWALDEVQASRAEGAG